jgi:hypothetical protein
MDTEEKPDEARLGPTPMQLGLLLVVGLAVVTALFW